MFYFKIKVLLIDKLRSKDIVITEINNQNNLKIVLFRLKCSTVFQYTFPLFGRLGQMPIVGLLLSSVFIVETRFFFVYSLKEYQEINNNIRSELGIKNIHSFLLPSFSFRFLNEKIVAKCYKYVKQMSESFIHWIYYRFFVYKGFVSHFFV